VKKAGETQASARTGAVTLIQRFGNPLNLNIHFHMLFVDGVYVEAGERLRFRRVKAPERAELEALVRSLSERVGRHLERRGLLERDAENGYLAPEPERSRREARGASKEARQGPGRAGDLAAAGRKRGQPTPKRAGVPVGQGGGGGAGMRIYRCGLPATGARPGRKEARFAVACAAEAVYAAYTSRRR